MNPGSIGAINAGCTCPVLDNAHGKGYLGQMGIYAITAGCPVHNPTRECLNLCGRMAVPGQKYCSGRCEAEARGDIG